MTLVLSIVVVPRQLPSVSFSVVGKDFPTIRDQQTSRFLLFFLISRRRLLPSHCAAPASSTNKPDRQRLFPLQRSLQIGTATSASRLLPSPAFAPTSCSAPAPATATSSIRAAPTSGVRTNQIGNEVAYLWNELPEAQQLLLTYLG
ncbi:unnamed protein product [Citrullus colocynthis]|uniref:Uncharacterized protein n=1 Tax=Citrullus colocynthis TaxID=252529 RepID=A0ABP0Y586_9ROSI